MYIPRRFAVTASLMLLSHAALAQGTAGSTPTPTSTAGAKSAAEKVIAALQRDTAIRAYQWTETMVVSVDGKEKDTVVNACSYNAAGRVARSPVDAKAQPAGAPGTAGEIDAYVTSAVALMREYVRPDADKLEACVKAGRVVATTEAGHEKLAFRDYLKPGDNLSLTVDPGTGAIESLSASSYMTNVVDRAEIHTEMAKLPDGTAYPSRIKFDTPGRQMGVVVTNSDYRKKTGQ